MASLSSPARVFWPSRHLYIEPLSLGLPKLPRVPDVANHLVCSVCGARNNEFKSLFTRGLMRDCQG
jgi:hypothetical protein